MTFQTVSLLNSVFAAKGANCYLAIVTVIFSHVKITCYFHMGRYHVFAGKLTWYLIGVHINKSSYYLNVRIINFKV